MKIQKKKRKQLKKTFSKLLYANIRSQARQPICNKLDVPEKRIREDLCETYTEHFSLD